MSDLTYIFGYQSILNSSSLSVNLRQCTEEPDLIPARLLGWRRDWSAVRRFSDHPTKRYVRLPDWAPVERAAFANVRADGASWVSGVLRPVATDLLPGLDFREAGYRRVRVNAQIRAYPGFALREGVSCEVYVDDGPVEGTAPVSQAYYDMGHRGAQRLDHEVPGFAADYLQTTPVPGELCTDMRFVFFSRDARHLWLLEERDSSLILLLKFSQTQFDTDMPTNAIPPEWHRPVSAQTCAWDWRLRPSEGPKEGAACPAPWLERLAYTQTDRVNEASLNQLAQDQDAWVRRAAIIRLGKNT